MKKLLLNIKFTFYFFRSFFSIYPLKLNFGKKGDGILNFENKYHCIKND